MTDHPKETSLRGITSYAYRSSTSVYRQRLRAVTSVKIKKRKKRKKGRIKKPVHVTSHRRPPTFRDVKVPRPAWSGDHVFVLLLGFMKYWSRSHDERWSRRRSHEVLVSVSWWEVVSSFLIAVVGSVVILLFVTFYPLPRSLHGRIFAKLGTAVGAADLIICNNF